MSAHPDRRDHRRVILGPGHSASFSLEGEDFQNVSLSNLSDGGCFALVDKGRAHLFVRGTVLERLTLGHSELPKGPIAATVAYALDHQSLESMMDLVGVGVQFLSMAPETRSALAAWVHQAWEKQATASASTEEGEDR
jgi:c-di-GMP-binding flagellar brake protein YcgR